MKSSQSLPVLCLVLALGLPLGGLAADFPISTGATGEYDPDVSYEPASNQFLTVWGTLNWGGIYAQRVATNGSMVGLNFPVAASGGHPAVASKSGESLVVWEKSDAKTISGQRVAGDGSLVGGPIVVAAMTYVSNDRWPDVAYSSGDNEYLVVWDDYDAVTLWNIHGALVDGTSGAVGPVITICTAAENQRNPKVAYNSVPGEYLVVWDDRRSNPTSADIYAQRVKSSPGLVGVLVGGNVAISTATPHETRPALAYNAASNRYEVVWDADVAGTGPRSIIGQYVNTNGAPVGASVLISSTGAESSLARPDVTFGAVTNLFKVVWRESTDDIYGQWLASDGSLQGANFIVCNAAGVQEEPAIASSVGGNAFLAVWSDQRDVTDTDIYGEIEGVEGGGGGGASVPKWIQYPDPTGWDVMATAPALLADDFRCTKSGPITNVTFWGSWHGDILAALSMVHLSIHADIPDPDGGGPLYSMPATPPLWQRTVAGPEVLIKGPFYGEQGWFEPPGFSQRPDHEKYYQYVVSIPPDQAFTQQVDTIYWLDINVTPDQAQGGAWWGWKTSTNHWNDDAVYWDTQTGQGQWKELRDPQPPEKSLDLAFALYGGGEQPVEEMDYGDAPDSDAVPRYPTLLAHNGARHTIVQGGPWFGDPTWLETDVPDSEGNGQPDATATGDDAVGAVPDDEDGIAIPTLRPGVSATVVIHVGQNGWVDGWIDWNKDGTWQDPAERVIGQSLPTGSWYLSVQPPPGAAIGQTFARFRIHTGKSTLPPTGPAEDGEVEDHAVRVLEEQTPDPAAKWWQPPDLTALGTDTRATYPNLMADDFLCTNRSAVTTIVIWGSWRNDLLPPGGPANVPFVLSFHADVPDPDGEGPGFSKPQDPPLWYHSFLPGQYGVSEVNLIDGKEWWYNPHTSHPTNYFPGDHGCFKYTFQVPLAEAFVQTGSVVNPVVYWLDVQLTNHPSVMENAEFGWKTSYRRWNDDATWAIGRDPNPGPWAELRFASPHPQQGVSMDMAFALYGEEPPPDEAWDFGDAPDNLQVPRYPTLLVNNGARHVIVTGGPWFGDPTWAEPDRPDAEGDGQPTATATGDDAAGATPDDEDGIVIPVLQAGVPSTITIFVGQTGWVDGWVDWNGDGVWQEPGERVVGQVLATGPYFLAVTPPVGSTNGQTYARFRIHIPQASPDPLLPTGLAKDGEVEDHLVRIRSFPPPLGLKWRQPPDVQYGINIQSWLAPQGPGGGDSGYVVADDWWCDGRPINAIRWWGSYVLYEGPTNGMQGVRRPSGFRLSWYLDIPTNGGRVAYSRPGPLLKQIVVPLLPEGALLSNTNEVSEVYVNTVPLDFLGPAYAGKHEHKFKYEVVLGDPWNEKNTLSREGYQPPCSSNIYWLAIEAIYYFPPEMSEHPWGWETTPRRFNWNDDAVLATNTPAGRTPWKDMTYVPAISPWEAATQHPYMSNSVNMAFNMLSEVVGRRDVKWQQLPNMELGTDMPSWRWQDPYGNHPGGGVQALRADDFISDGRRITDIHWWGSYIGWMSGVDTNEFGGGQPPPTGVNRPLGFDLSWHAHDATATPPQPGALITNVFIPIERCHEMYYCTIEQTGNTEHPYEHEYQYYVDLLDEQLDTLPWYEQAGTQYWLNVQAVFANGFVPGGPAGGVHEGWGWKISGIEPDLRLCPSVVSNYAPLATWQQSHLPPWHPKANMPHDLAFELTTDRPNTNAVIRITSFQRDTNTLATTVSLGVAGAGQQYLQSCTNSLISAVWVAVETNEAPFPPPAVNTWLRPGASFSNEFFRVIEVAP